ncbi:MAG: hypothetical protein PHS04_02125 [Tissierellia bacterium]|nr:hypothetical protein [Tissierellia bacterium]
MRNANKNNEEKTRKGKPQEKRKNVLSTFMENIEKQMQSEREKQRSERPVQWEQPAQPSMLSDPPVQPSILSDLPKSKAPSKPATLPKPVGLEIDYIGGDEEIGGINEAGFSKGSKNNIGLDIKRDILKGIIYSEILSEPKSLRK